MDIAVAALLEELDLDGRTDLEKTELIYKYICDNITYDYTNLEDDTYKLKYTAYAALINKTAVCQGYAVLLYRLLLEEGIDTRYIRGWATSNMERHGWNIIHIGDYYYLADATWDAGNHYWQWFLRGTTDFDNHTPEDAYLTDEFTTMYPVSETGYYGENTDETGFKYTICNSSGVITGREGTDSVDELVIPEKVGDYTVSQIGEEAFCQDDIVSVTVPSTVEIINYAAFFNILSLKEVHLQSGLKSIGNMAFKACHALTMVNIPSGTRSIGTQAFYNCSKLSDVYIPASVTQIGQ